MRMLHSLAKYSAGFHQSETQGAPGAAWAFEVREHS